MKKAPLPVKPSSHPKLPLMLPLRECSHPEEPWSVVTSSTPVDVDSAPVNVVREDHLDFAPASDVLNCGVKFKPEPKHLSRKIAVRWAFAGINTQALSQDTYYNCIHRLATEVTELDRLAAIQSSEKGARDLEDGMGRSFCRWRLG
eukprot:3476194-Amphidinium_carterae.1